MKIKSKKIILSLMAFGIIGTTSAANAFQLPAPIQQVWDATVGRVASTFSDLTSQYLGALVDEYLPKGMSAVFGAIGLPDPSEIFSDIRTGKEGRPFDPSELPNSINGESQINSLSGVIGEAVGSSYFSEKSQEINKQANDALAQSVEASSKSGEEAMKLNTTQEIMKLQSNQLAQLNASMAVVAQKTEQGNQQAAASNLTGAAVSKKLSKEERIRQAEIEAKIKGIAGQSAYMNGMLDEK